jgi:hypothetical protein
MPADVSTDQVRAAVAARFSVGDGAAASGQPAGNEFVVFTKPELGRLGEDDLATVWDLLAGALADYDVTVHRSRIQSGPELEASGAMAEHYGVINEISRLGRPVLTEPAERALQEHFGAELESAEVVGGHQFLAAYPDFSPYALGVLFANAGVTRLGPGTYAALVRLDGDPVIILNGFHPRQLGFFTAEDTVCAFLHCSSPTEWARLRADLIGATDPAKAAAASIRGRLFADPAAFGLATVSYNFNGVHMSAGPLEGLAELQRFFGADQRLTDWTFGRALTTAGVAAADVAGLTHNPVLQAGDARGTAFDLTEGIDAEPAAKLLASATAV